jgi:p-hydroxybenzoate 3-monooxygenase
MSICTHSSPTLNMPNMPNIMPNVPSTYNSPNTPDSSDSSDSPGSSHSSDSPESSNSSNPSPSSPSTNASSHASSPGNSPSVQTSLQTQVIIVGAGPSGLLLGALLHKAGIDHVIVERQSGEYVLGRIRAGLLEQGTTDLLHAVGAGDRLKREGLRHDSFALTFKGQFHRINISERQQGRYMTVYGQTEVTRDLMAHRAAAGRRTYYEAQDVSIRDFDSDTPSIEFKHQGARVQITARFIAGCDGYHGVCRASVPQRSVQTFEKIYPFGWLGVLCDTPPVYHDVTYSNTERGFALSSMRSNTRSRYYIQCRSDEAVESWSDEAFWTEFKQRIDPQAAERLITGPSIEKSIAPLRSFVTEPMRFGSLFLAGDAAHIVPPTGAKGLNLAAGDVSVLAQAVAEYFHERSSAGINDYSTRCLRRVWKAERFSWWFTSLMHRFPDTGAFGQRIQEAELDYLIHSEAALCSITENYVGLPH